MSDKKHYAGMQWDIAEQCDRSKEKRPVLTRSNIKTIKGVLFPWGNPMIPDQIFPLDGGYVLSRESTYIFAGYNVTSHSLLNKRSPKKMLVEWVHLGNLDSLRIPNNIKEQIRPILTVFEMQKSCCHERFDRSDRRSVI